MLIITLVTLGFAGAAVGLALWYRRELQRERRATLQVSYVPDTAPCPDPDIEAMVADFARQLLTTRQQLAAARSRHAMHLRRCTRSKTSG